MRLSEAFPDGKSNALPVPTVASRYPESQKNELEHLKDGGKRLDIIGVPALTLAASRVG